MALPQPFRAAAEEGLFITRGFERCLQAFPAATWHTLARRVGELPLTADGARSLRRILFGPAVILAPGPHDLLAIPHHLVHYAGIDAEVVCVGCATYFEIWSPEALCAVADAPALERYPGLAAWLAPSYTPARA